MNYTTVIDKRKIDIINDSLSDTIRINMTDKKGTRSIYTSMDKIDTNMSYRDSISSINSTYSSYEVFSDIAAYEDDDYISTKDNHPVYIYTNDVSKNDYGVFFAILEQYLSLSQLALFETSNVELYIMSITTRLVRQILSIMATSMNITDEMINTSIKLFNYTIEYISELLNENRSKIRRYDEIKNVVSGMKIKKNSIKFDKCKTLVSKTVYIRVKNTNKFAKRVEVRDTGIVDNIYTERRSISIPHTMRVNITNIAWNDVNVSEIRDVIVNAVSVIGDYYMCVSSHRIAAADAMNSVDEYGSTYTSDERNVAKDPYVGTIKYRRSNIANLSVVLMDPFTAMLLTIVDNIILQTLGFVLDLSTVTGYYNGERVEAARLAKVCIPMSLYADVYKTDITTNVMLSSLTQIWALLSGKGNELLERMRSKGVVSW